MKNEEFLQNLPKFGDIVLTGVFVKEKADLARESQYLSNFATFVKICSFMFLSYRNFQIISYEINIPDKEVSEPILEKRTTGILERCKI